MRQYKPVLDAGDESSTGEFEDVLFGASTVLLLLPKESDDPRKVEHVKVVAGESMGFELRSESVYNGELYCCSSKPGVSSK